MVVPPRCPHTAKIMAPPWSNVENIKSAVPCLELKSEAPAAEEMLDCVVCSCEQFSFQMCLESGDGSGTFRNWRQDSSTPDSWCRDTECFGLKVDPFRQLIE